MIHIAATGLGNIASVRNMLDKAGCKDVRIAARGEELEAAEKIVLPGVGSFDAGVSALAKNGLSEAIKSAALRGAHVLGICLGMQLLFESSEEGRMPGLGLIPGKVERFKSADRSLKIPHIGWNEVHPVRDSALFETGGERQRFYHVHSYHAVCGESADIAAVTLYGYEFASAVQRGNVMGCQFHPEKSHRFGIALMKRFIEMKPC